MVQTRSNVPTTSHVVGEENAPGSDNGTGGIGSTPDAVQALFGLGVTAEQLQVVVAALSALGGNVPDAGAGKAPLGSHAEHAATSQHKGKKTRRSRRRPGKALAIEEVIVEDVPEEEDDESSRRRHAEESATSNARSARPERSGERRDERTQHHHSPTRTEKTKVSDQGVSRLAREIAELKRRVETRAPYSQPILRTVTPFTPRVMSIPLPANFRPWQIKAYNGTTDPQDHLSKFYASMEAAAAPDEVKCRYFLATLEGSACDWFNRLPKGTIDDWDTLAERFLTHFAANRRQTLPYSHLLNICTCKGEKVRDFITRWEKEAKDVHGADDQALVAMFQAALPRGEVRKELRKNPPPTYQETLARAKFLASQEFDDAPDSEAAPAKRAPADSGEAAKKRRKKKDYTAGPRTASAGVYSVGAPVGTGRELALSPLPHKEMQRLIARRPAPRDNGAAPSRGPPEGRTWRKPTEPVAVATHARNPEKRHIGQECDDLDEDEAQGYPVGFIHGGNIGGDFAAQRKRWKHMAFVAKVQQAPAPKLGRREQIQFTEKDLPNTPSPHQDALVVRIEINNAIVHRTLVDTGSSVNIICAHNMILGRPGLEDLECVISPYYLCMKFPTPSRIGVARRDQKLARSCYVRITKKLARDETLVVHAQEEMRKLEARPKAEPAEEVEEVPLDPRTPERKVKVGASLAGSQRKRLVDVLATYRVIFAWGPGDMPGVDPKVICHRLAVNLEARPVKQKKRFLSSERREFVSKEIPRAENAEADILSKLSSDTLEHIRRMANVEELSEPSIHAFPVAMIYARPRDWMDDIIAFLKNGALPDDATKAKLVRTRAPGYALEGKKLYKRAYNGTLLRCLRPAEAEQVMEEVHAGICSTHQGAYAVSRKITLQGYFWPTIVKDCAEFVRKCKVCQEFQKWVEAAPLASITGAQCQKFLAKQVICRFGVPEHVITDNGTQFESKPFNDFLESWGIKHSYASVGYPQANGQVENANRTIVDRLKQKLEACGGEWAEELPYILWTYRTMPRRATEETPFALCYGFEARAPAEISIATHREEVFDPERNEEALAAELHLVHERREAAFIRAENYRRKVKSYHDGRVRARGFVEGDWVLRKRTVSRSVHHQRSGGPFDIPPADAERRGRAQNMECRELS
ncbi:unnamed protein product [Cuscuta campestris]|uniref:Integrase catalytic domain-containing protein n=1 Tax=Cuscuta campestris TaxID=132261 RepID=A0A484L4X9_9ASTE|nr:unnamed protein product [Cuscuta campestris]